MKSKFKLKTSRILGCLFIFLLVLLNSVFLNVPTIANAEGNNGCRYSDGTLTISESNVKSSDIASLMTENNSKLTDIKKVVIEKEVQNIFQGVLSGISNVERIEIPFIGLESQNISQGNRHYPIGVLFGTNLFDGAVKTEQYASRDYVDSSNSNIFTEVASNTSDKISYYIPSSLTEVVVTNAKYVFGYSFYGCTNLQKVTLNSGVEYISTFAFSGCASLTELNLEVSSGFKTDNLKTIGTSSFSGCTSLVELNLEGSASLKTLSDSAFFGCTSLQKITLPSNLESIKDNVFNGCTALSAINLKNVKTIGNYSFQNCGALTDDILNGSSITSIGNYAFFNCQNLENQTFPTDLISIGNYAFSVCKKFSELVIDCSNLEIGNFAFADCSGIEIVNIVSSKSIGESVFSGCSKINTVSVCSSTIGKNSFANCANIATLSVNAKTIGESAFSGCTGVTEITLIEGLETIGKNAFSNMNKVKTLVIPNSVNSIAEAIFAKMYGLEELTIPFVGRDNNMASTASLVHYPLGDMFGTENYTGAVRVDQNITKDYYVEESETFYNATSQTKSYYIPTSLKKVTVTNSNYIFGYSFANCKNLTEITLNDEINGIYNNAFYNCTSLEKIDLPENLKYIGDSCFELCSVLTEVNTYNKIVTIGANSFKNCSKLETISLKGIVVVSKEAFSGCQSLSCIELGNDLKEISDKAFYMCISLTSILSLEPEESSESTYSLLPSSIEIIGESAFESCVKLNTPNFGILEHLETIGISSYKNCSSFAGTLKISSSVKTIGDYAFSGCVKIEEIDFAQEGNLTIIGGYIFENLFMVDTLTIPSSVQIIGHYAFSKMRGLKSLTVPFVGYTNKDNDVHYTFGSMFDKDEDTEYKYYYRSITQAETVSDASNTNGYNSTENKTKTYYIPLDLKTIVITNSKYIFGYTFKNCHFIESLTLSDNLELIYSYAFAGCSGLTSLELPDSLLYISSYAFTNCKGLINFEIPLKVCVISNGVFSECDKLESVTLGENVNYIGASAFQNCTKLTNINLGELVETIENKAFYNCSSLKYFPTEENQNNLLLPSSIKEIKESAFQNCSNLNDQDFNKMVNLKEIGNSAFSGCDSFNEIKIPENIKTLGAYSFASCDGATLIEVHAESVGNFAFSDCSNVSKIVIDSKEILKNSFANCYSVTSVVISNKLISIGERAFGNMNNLTELTIPNSVESFEKEAFYGMNKLVTLTIPFVGSSNNIVISMTDKDQGVIHYPLGWMFEENRISGSKTSQHAPYDYIFYSGKDTYENKSSLTTKTSTYNIPETLKTVNITNSESIFGYTFENCTNIESINLNLGVKRIFRNAFENSGIANIVFDVTDKESFESELTFIDRQAFKNCKNLKTITIPEKVLIINEGLFDGCVGLVKVALGESVVTISDSVFSGCEMLETVNLPETITSIGNSAFSNCREIIEIKIPTKLTVISESLFEGCTNLEVVSLGENITNISKKAFKDCVGLNAINLCDKIIGIGESAFESCSSLPTVILPLNLKNIEKRAFYGCSTFDKIVISENVETIGESAFENCNKTRTLTIDSDVLASIDKRSFANLPLVTTLVIPKSVKDIGEASFAGMTSLECLTIPFVGKNQNVTIINQNTIQHYPLGFVFGSENLGGNPVQQRTSNDYCNRINDTLSYEFKDGSSQTYYIPSSLNTVNITNSKYIFGYAFYNCSMISTINLNTEVEAISAYAFSHCGISNINLLSTIEYIGKNAFEYSNIVNIEIPYKIKTINASTFESCKSLENVKIGNNVSSVLDNAFKDCINATIDIDKKSGSIEIGNFAFSNCKSVVYKVENEEIITYNKSDEDINTTYCFLKNSDEVENGETINVTLISTETNATNLQFIHEFTASNKNYKVTKIGDRGFADCRTIQTITLERDIESIGNYAFSDCINLKSVTIQSDCKILGNYVFNNCKNLEQATVQAIENIGDYAFCGCEKLININITGCNDLGAYAFYGCDALNTVTIGTHQTVIKESTFKDCSSLETVYISSNVTEIGDFAFENCVSLKEFIKGSQDFQLKSIGKCAFKNDKAFTDRVINYSKKLESIGEYAFYGCSSLQNITLPDTVTEIKVSTFENCKNLKSITFYNYLGEESYKSIKLKSIEDSAFYNTNLDVFDFGEELTNLGSVVFKNTNIKDVYIPDSIESVGQKIFENCELETVSIPCSATLIGYYNKVFEGNGDDYTITIRCLKDENENVINGEISDYLLYNVKAETIEIEEGIRSIGKYSFAYSSIYDIVLPKSLEVIGDYAFANCANITEVMVLENVTAIGSYAFSRCYNLKDIYLPNTITKIDASAFYKSTEEDIFEKLTVTIYKNENGSSEIIDGLLFSQHMEYVVVADGITKIGNDVFNGCKNLIKVTLPGTISLFGNNVFYGDANIVLEITSSDEGFIIDEGLYKNKLSNVRTVSINEGITEIGKEAFSGNQYLENINLPSTIEAIGESAFYNCTQLMKLEIKDNDKFTKISNSICYSCEKLEEVKIPNAVTEIGQNAFNGCKNIKNIVLPSSCETIGRAAFYHCHSIEKIETIITNNEDISGYESIINDYNNRNGKNLKTSIINCKEIGIEAFVGCDKLEALILGDNVETIGNKVFQSCSNLEICILGKNIKLLPELFLDGCNKLTSIYIFGPVDEIKDGALFGTTENLIFNIGYNTYMKYIFENTYKINPNNIKVTDDIKYIFTIKFIKDSDILNEDNMLFVSKTNLIEDGVLMSLDTSKTPNNNYDYTFVGWIEESKYNHLSRNELLENVKTAEEIDNLSCVGETETYIAIYEEAARKYSVIFNNIGKDRSSYSYQVEFSENIDAPEVGDYEDVSYEYDFEGWFVNKTGILTDDYILVSTDFVNQFDGLTIEKLYNEFTNPESEYYINGMEVGDSIYFVAKYNNEAIKYKVEFKNEDAVVKIVDEEVTYKKIDSEFDETLNETLSLNLDIIVSGDDYPGFVTDNLYQANWTITVTNPQINKTAQFSYKFIGWIEYNSETEEFGEFYSTKEKEDNIAFNVVGDVTYIACFTVEKVKYNIHFYPYTGSELSDFSIEFSYGEKIHFNEDENIKIEKFKVRNTTKEFVYDFKGWTSRNVTFEDLSDIEVKEEKTYQAAFDRTDVSYVLELENSDGNKTREETYSYRNIIKITDEPIKVSNKEYTYNFVGWNVYYGNDKISDTIFDLRDGKNYNVKSLLVKDNKEEYDVGVVSSKDEQKVITLKPCYEPCYIDYKIVFVNDGKLFESKNDYHYNDTITYPVENPTKSPDEKYGYVFSKWLLKLGDEKEDISKLNDLTVCYIAENYSDSLVDNTITFEAEYNNEIIKYEVKFETENSEVVYNPTGIEWDNFVKFPTDEVVKKQLEKQSTAEFSYEFNGWKLCNSNGETFGEIIDDNSKYSDLIAILRENEKDYNISKIVLKPNYNSITQIYHISFYDYNYNKTEENEYKLLSSSDLEYGLHTKIFPTSQNIESEYEGKKYSFTGYWIELSSIHESYLELIKNVGESNKFNNSSEITVEKSKIYVRYYEIEELTYTLTLKYHNSNGDECSKDITDLKYGTHDITGYISELSDFASEYDKNLEHFVYNGSWSDVLDEASSCSPTNIGISKNCTYKANYSSSGLEYSVYFYSDYKDEDFGTTYRKITINKNKNSISPEDVRDPNSPTIIEGYVYEFSGWNECDETGKSIDICTYDKTHFNFNIDRNRYFRAVYKVYLQRYKIEFYEFNEYGEQSIITTGNYDKTNDIEIPHVNNEYKTNEYKYTFKGWIKNYSGNYPEDAENIVIDIEPNEKTIKINKNVTYTAYYSREQRLYTITWKNGDNAITTNGGKYGDFIELPTTPNKDSDYYYNYSFDAWKSGEIKFSDENGVRQITQENFSFDNNDLAVCSAEFKEEYIEYYVYYYMKENRNHECGHISIHYGELIPYKTDDERLEGVELSYITKTGNQIKYVAEKFYIFRDELEEINDNNGGIKINSDIIKDDKVKVYIGFVIDRSEKYTIEFKAREYNKETEQYIEKTIFNDEFTYGEKVTSPKIVEKYEYKGKEYTFTGWDPNFDGRCNGNATYTAQYSEEWIEYSVTFFNINSKDEKVKIEEFTKTYHYGEKITEIPNKPTKSSSKTTDYEFIGWILCNKDCEVINEYKDKYLSNDELKTIEVFKDLCCVAKYEEFARKYSITFLNSDEKTFKEFKLEYEAKIIEPDEIPTIEHDDPSKKWNFIGWAKYEKGATYSKDNCIDFKNSEQKVTGNLKYIAVYEEIQRDYTIKFVDYNNETIVESSTIDYNKPYSEITWSNEFIGLPENPTREADNTYTYEFLGWAIYNEEKEKYLESDVIELPDTATENVTYIAVYKEVYINYIVKFLNDDKTLILDDINYHYNDTITIPNITKEQDNTYTYKFLGWAKYNEEKEEYSNSDVIKVSENVKESVIYIAVYEKTYINYIVKFFNDDKTVISEKKYHYNDKIEVPEAIKSPSNYETYSFVGWDNTVSIECKGDAQYIAQYKASNRIYKITFEMNDGNVKKDYNVPTTYEYSVGLKLPTKDDICKTGYRFLGWTEKNNKNYISEISSEAYGDKTYYANWEKVYKESTSNNIVSVIVEKDEDLKKGIDLTPVFNNIKDDDSVVSISFPNGSSVTFNNEAAKQLSSVSDVELKMETGDTSKYEDCKLVLNISLDGCKFENGKATVSYKFTEKAPKGKVAKVYYVDENNNRTDMKAQFDGTNLTFETNHFSTYIVVFENDKSGNVVFIIIILLAVLVPIGVVVFIIFKQKHKKENIEDFDY